MYHVSRTDPHGHTRKQRRRGHVQAIVGKRDSGKSTIVEAYIEALSRRGRRVILVTWQTFANRTELQRWLPVLRLDMDPGWIAVIDDDTIVDPSHFPGSQLAVQCGGCIVTSTMPVDELVAKMAQTSNANGVMGFESSSMQVTLVQIQRRVGVEIFRSDAWFCSKWSLERHTTHWWPKLDRLGILTLMMIRHRFSNLPECESDTKGLTWSRSESNDIRQSRRIASLMIPTEIWLAVVAALAGLDMPLGSKRQIPSHSPTRSHREWPQVLADEVPSQPSPSNKEIH
jgi:hypothetical protein